MPARIALSVLFMLGMALSFFSPLGAAVGASPLGGGVHGPMTAGTGLAGRQEDKSPVTWMDPLVIVTAVLAFVTAILAVVTWKLANIAEREFRAGRLPNVIVKWPSKELETGSRCEHGVLRHHVRVTGELQSLNKVKWRLDDVTATVKLVQGDPKRTLSRDVSLEAFPNTKRTGFSILVERNPATDYRAVRASFEVHARLAISARNGAGTETWTARIEVAQTGSESFGIVDNSRGRVYRDRDQSYWQRLKTLLQHRKREIQARDQCQ